MGIDSTHLTSSVYEGEEFGGSKTPIHTSLTEAKSLKRRRSGLRSKAVHDPLFWLLVPSTPLVAQAPQVPSAQVHPLLSINWLKLLASRLYWRRSSCLRMIWWTGIQLCGRHCFSTNFNSSSSPKIHVYLHGFENIMRAMQRWSQKRRRKLDQWHRSTT